MDTKILAVLSVFMLIFSIVVFFNRDVDNFDVVQDSYDCRNLQIPSKCRMLHGFWNDYNKTMNNSYARASQKLTECPFGMMGGIGGISNQDIMDKMKAAVQILNIRDLSTKQDQLTYNDWIALLDETSETRNDGLITRVTNLENQLIQAIEGGNINLDSELDKELRFDIDNLNKSDQQRCEELGQDGAQYSFGDIIKALWCKLSCGYPNRELADLSNPNY